MERDNMSMRAHLLLSGDPFEEVTLELFAGSPPVPVRVKGLKSDLFGDGVQWVLFDHPETGEEEWIPASANTPIGWSSTATPV